MITILSRDEAVNFIAKNPDHPIIAIGETFNNDVERVTSLANCCLCLRFNDIEYEGKDCVQDHHIEEALEWAKPHEDLVVACRAGISRSSAFAYLIECTRSGPEAAKEILCPDIHQPNRLVVDKGARILENDDVQEQFFEWMKELYSRYL